MAATLAGEIVDEPGLVQPALLDVREVERPVAHDGPPRLAPYCFWFIGSCRARAARSRALKPIVAEVAVEVAVQRVGAALGHDVDVAAERAAEFRLPARGHHLELIDGVHAVRNAAQPRRIVVGRQAVDDEVVRKVALAATESLTPGTADVSANSCVLPTLVGDTPGTSSARSRKLRPFSGRLRPRPARRCRDLAARRLEHGGVRA